MQNLKEYNDDYVYILTVIDVFSKKAYARRLKQKTANNIIDAFRSIFEDNGQKPLKMQTDKGKEFVAKEVQKFFKENDVNNFTSSNPEVKACIVERFNRMLKTRMYRYLFHQNDGRYIDDLQDMVDGYNNSYHRSIMMTPNEVNESNVLEVYRNLYKTLGGEKKKLAKLKMGDYVRLSKNKDIFAKGYTMSFTEEVFKIIKVIPHMEPVYEIEDLNREKVEGQFYEKEVQKVNYNPEGVFVVEEVIKTRGKGKNAQCFVKWRGYPTSFNSWISASELKQL